MTRDDSRPITADIGSQSFRSRCSLSAPQISSGFGRSSRTRQHSDLHTYWSACRRGGRWFRGTAVHGDIDIIPANTPARWEMLDENDTDLLLSLPQALLDSTVVDTGDAASSVELRNRHQIRDSELETLCWAIQREMQAGYPSGRLYLDGLGLAVASRLVTRHSSVGNAPEAPKGVLSGHRLKQVLAFIEDQLAEDLSLDQIASVAGLSPSHTRTLFRRAIGVPLHQFIIQRRVELGRSLLLHSSLSIAEIAQTLVSRTRATWRGICVGFSASHQAISRAPLSAPNFSIRMCSGSLDRARKNAPISSYCGNERRDLPRGIHSERRSLGSFMLPFAL